jgi:hypothetical protein
MENSLKSTCDGILQQVTIGKPRVPGVVTMLTDRTANIYQGASGVHSLGTNEPYEHRHCLRHLLDYEGNHRHGDYAVR